MLTAAGASVTVRNNRGETCLHRASVGGHVEAVSAIVGRYTSVVSLMVRVVCGVYGCVGCMVRDGEEQP